MLPFLTGSSENDANVALLVAEHPRVNDPNLSITCIYEISHEHPSSLLGPMLNLLILR
jgi:hypothetical protein